MSGHLNANDHLILQMFMISLGHSRGWVGRWLANWPIGNLFHTFTSDISSKLLEELWNCVQPWVHKTVSYIHSCFLPFVCVMSFQSPSTGKLWFRVHSLSFSFLSSQYLTWIFISLFLYIPPQFDVGSSCPGRQVLQPSGYHDHLLLPLDHLCCRGSGHHHGVHHPPRWSCAEGGLWRKQEAHDQLCWRSAGPHSVGGCHVFPIVYHHIGQGRWPACEVHEQHHYAGNIEEIHDLH